MPDKPIDPALTPTPIQTEPPTPKPGVVPGVTPQPGATATAPPPESDPE